MSTEAAPDRCLPDADADAACRVAPRLPRAIRAVEMTQAIQHLPLDRGDLPRRGNALPLIAGRSLFVRVYASKGAAEASDLILATAVVSLGAVAVDATVLGPLRPEDVGRGRRAASSSSNLFIPGHLIAAGTTIVVRLLGSEGGQVTELGRQSLRPDVIEVPALPVQTVPIALDVRDVGRFKQTRRVDAPGGDAAPVLFRAGLRLPIPRLDIVATAPARGFTVGWKDGPQEVRAALRAQDVATTVDVVVVGLLDEKFVSLDPGSYGYGGSGIAVALGDRPGCLAHELGHVLRRRHSPCAGGVYDPAYPQHWPLPAGAIDDVGFRFPEGSGTGMLEALAPEDCFDYMGTADCTPEWTSAYGWIVAQRGARARAWRRRAPRACRMMLLDLTVAAPDDAVLGPSHFVDARPPAPLGPPSGYSVEMRDACRTILGRSVLHRLDLTEHRITGPDVGAFPARFIEAIPWDDRAHELVVRHGGDLVSVITLAEDAPGIGAVAVVGPDANGAHEISWAADPRNDVHHLVRYSPGGSDWYAIETAFKGDALTVDLRGLPAGDACVIEVAASRRGRTALSRSEPFARERQPRQAVIALPRPLDDGGPRRVSPTALVEFAGWAFSPDEPPAVGDELQWRAVDQAGGETVLGQGPRLVMAARDLPAGLVTVHLDVAGGRGATTQITTRGGGGTSRVRGTG